MTTARFRNAFRGSITPAFRGSITPAFRGSIRLAFRGSLRNALHDAIGPTIRCAAGLAIALSLAGCAPTPSAKSAGTTHHVVICWLKEPGNVAARQKLIFVSKGFAGIPGVVGVRAGEPQPSSRRNVDASFDVAIIMEFEDRHALDAYLEHPRHVTSTRDVLAPLTSRVVIYDFED